MNGENPVSLTQQLNEISGDLVDFQRDEVAASRRRYEKLGLRVERKLERRTSSHDILFVRHVRSAVAKEIDEFEILKALAEAYYSVKSIDILLIEGLENSPTIHIFCGVSWQRDEYPTILWRETSVKFAVELVSRLFIPRTIANDVVEKLMAELVSQDIELATSSLTEWSAARTEESENTTSESVEDHPSSSEVDDASVGDVPYEAVFRFAMFKAVRDSGPLDTTSLKTMIKKELERKKSRAFEKEFTAARSWNLRNKKLCTTVNRSLALYMNLEEAMTETVDRFVNQPRGRK